jgi:hypothetical protein
MGSLYNLEGEASGNELLKTVILYFDHHQSLLNPLQFGSSCFHFPVNRMPAVPEQCPWFETISTKGLDRVDFLSYLLHLETKIELVSKI